MSIVIALGGHAISRVGQGSLDAQRAAIRHAAQAIGESSPRHDVVVTHGNGPHVGLMAMQAAVAGHPLPLDVLGAESEGMIGYWIEQELRAALHGRDVAALLTQVEVREDDPAFKDPTKPIGPVLSPEHGQRLAREFGWSFGEVEGGVRRLVPSPVPQRVLEVSVIQLLVRLGVVVVCGGGGGVPVVADADGRHHGVEAVVDKDASSALLATELGARQLLLLTDVPTVFADWPEARRAIRAASPRALAEQSFEAGSMAPKVEAACRFVKQTGGTAHIGRLEDLAAILRGRAGTIVRPGTEPLQIDEEGGGA